MRSAELHRSRLAALAFAGLAFAVYNSNLRIIPSGDAVAARYLPFAILGHGTLDLDAFREVVAPPNVDPYWVERTRDGQLVSRYPIVTPIAVTPLYVPAVAYVTSKGATAERLRNVGELMEKVAASTIASISAGLMLLLLRRRMPPWDAALLAVAFAFGTNTWVTASQTLFQHGFAELLVVVLLLVIVITEQPSRLRIVAAGACMGLLAMARPPDAILAAGFAVAATRWARDRSSRIALCAAALVATLPFAAYNVNAFGSLTGGYVSLGVTSSQFWSTALLRGVAGLLVSPGKGLFVFSPFLLFLLFLPWLGRGWAHPKDKLLTAAALAGVALQVVVFAKTNWRGGWCYGPRYLTDALPILVWALVPVVQRLRGLAKVVFVAAVAVSVAIQWIGAFRYDFSSDRIYYRTWATDAPVFEPHNAAFLVELRHPPPPKRIAAILGGKLADLRSR
jgi:hypothetical protein